MVSLELREPGEVLEKPGLLQRRPPKQCRAFASEEGDNLFSRFVMKGRDEIFAPCQSECVDQDAVCLTKRPPSADRVTAVT